MEIQVVNFKAYSSGALVGFFDAVVGGLVVTGCKAFRKEDKLWFGWPSEKVPGDNGEVAYRDIVTAADPVMRHLQGLVRGQLRAALAESVGSPGQSRRASGRKPSELGDRGYQESRQAAQAADDIPF